MWEKKKLLEFAWIILHFKFFFITQVLAWDTGFESVRLYLYVYLHFSGLEQMYISLNDFF